MPCARGTASSAKSPCWVQCRAGGGGAGYNQGDVIGRRNWDMPSPAHYYSCQRRKKTMKTKDTWNRKDHYLPPSTYSARTLIFLLPWSRREVVPMNDRSRTPPVLHHYSPDSLSLSLSLFPECDTRIINISGGDSIDAERRIVPTPTIWRRRTPRLYSRPSRRW